MTGPLLPIPMDEDTEIRNPYWLSAQDRTHLADAIHTLLDNTTVFPRLRAHLEDVLTELGVVEAREMVWPDHSKLIRLARGYTPDVVPIRMSDDELHAVITLPILPEPLLTALGGPTESK